MYMRSPGPSESAPTAPPRAAAAQVADARGLRQARGAARVDVEIAIARDEARAHARVERVGRGLRERRVERPARAGQRRRRCAQYAGGRLLEVRQRARHSSANSLCTITHTDSATATQWASALPRRLWLISADDGADLREAELGDRELGAVADQERHDVAARDARSLRPVRDAIRRRVELGVRDLAAPRTGSRAGAAPLRRAPRRSRRSSLVVGTHLAQHG